MDGMVMAIITGLMCTTADGEVVTMPMDIGTKLIEYVGNLLSLRPLWQEAGGWFLLLTNIRLAFCSQ